MLLHCVLFSCVKAEDSLISRKGIFQLLLKVLKQRFLSQTGYFWIRFLPVIWKKNLELFIEPMQLGWADSLPAVSSDLGTLVEDLFCFSLYKHHSGDSILSWSR